MESINFSYNWNNKLECHAFTTLRLDQDKYKVGNSYAIRFKKYVKPNLVKIIDKRTFLLKDINEFIAYLDTGYSKDECINIIKKMYKNSAVDWNNRRLCLLLLVYTKEKSEPQGTLL